MLNVGIMESNRFARLWQMYTKVAKHRTRHEECAW